MAEESEKKKKSKRPTAIKREIQSEKRRLINKSFKSKVRTSVNELNDALASKDNQKIQTSLSALYSMMDKGVKKGLFKVNKASRIKARATAKATPKK